MPTGSWIVRLLGKAGSDRRTVKVTRMTQLRPYPAEAEIVPSHTPSAFTPEPHK